MKKIFFLLIISFSIISGLLVAEYMINSGFKDVDVENVIATTVEDYIELTGEVTEQNKREIKLDFPLKITKLYAEVGDKVKAGQKLADTDNTSLLKKLELAMVESLNPESFVNIISTVKYQNKEILSPINGVISSVNINEGDAATPDQPVITVTDTENLKVRSKISENSFREIYIGQNVLIYSDNSMINGKITKIYPVAQKIEGDKLSFVAFEITPDSCEDLTCGTVVQLKLCSEIFENVVVIPFESVMFDEEHPYVYVNVSGYAVKKRVVLGKEFETTVQIKEGLSEKDKLVINPKKYNLKNGDKLSDGEL